jgi:hypothetical protein
MNNLVVGTAMAQATRGLLFMAFVGVLGVAMFAGINSGEYMLTLATGALMATVIGIGFMTQAGTENQSKSTALGVQKSSIGSSQAIESNESLPDPMAQDFEMPL